MSNALRTATSPYLVQHADNPVDWREWSAAMLADAARLDRPILLSIGYAACHWCHVMAHESFEDDATAALMNARYVCVKVDREERPDIDHLYMSALQALGEQGGWPLTMFLRPDGAPFWGGTYFPPEPRWSRPSFRQVLAAVADAYDAGHDMVARNTAALAIVLARPVGTRGGQPLSPGTLDHTAAALLRLIDPVNGGLRGAPKFPNAPIFRFLWQHAIASRTEAGRSATHALLDHMIAGGIHDHLGGGFARYSTDAEWLAPHFEKMLYDNAQLLDLLALAHADRSSSRVAQAAAGIVDWLRRDMALPSADAPVGAFASAEDADSEGEEGRFYVWSAAEIADILGPDAESFATAYDVRPGGNWEGHTILRRITEDGTPADEARLSSCRARLVDRRAVRVRPARDDKMLADWNGLTITALVRAAFTFAQPDWLVMAQDAARTVLSRLSGPDGRIRHSWRDNRIGAAGLLDDQACMARACLALYEATDSPVWLETAIRLMAAAEAWFADGQGGFYLSASDVADLPMGPDARPRVFHDGPSPSGVGMMAEALARLFHLTGDPAWRTALDRLAASVLGSGTPASAAPTILAAIDVLEAGASVVIIGAGALAEELRAVALSHPDPAIVVQRRGPDQGVPAGHPAFGKSRPEGSEVVAFVCRGAICGLPVTNPADLRSALARPPRPTTMTTAATPA